MNPAPSAFKVNSGLQNFQSSKFLETDENKFDEGSDIFNSAFVEVTGNTFSEGSRKSHEQKHGLLETGQSGFIDYSSGSASAGTHVIKPVIKHGVPIVTKSFFIHEAPVEEAKHVEVIEKEHVVRPRKHFNIVFVKAPASGSKTINKNNVNVFPQNEEKTIVYVLTGRNDGVEVNEHEDIQVPEPKPPSKPEVVFVKYDNEEDVQKAISDIKSELCLCEQPFQTFNNFFDSTDKYEGEEDASVSFVGSTSETGQRTGLIQTTNKSSASSFTQAKQTHYTHSSMYLIIH